MSKYNLFYLRMQYVHEVRTLPLEKVLERETGYQWLSFTSNDVFKGEFCSLNMHAMYC